MGLVIGIGGSGIQTISRVRSAVVGDRPDAAATPSIQFLGVDAVNLSKQIPPLPPGVGLGAREFINLTERVFDAYAFVQKIGGSDTALKTWWDFNFQAPPGALVDGLKQSRMLGRLAFYRESANLASQISRAMSDAIALRRTHVEKGIAGSDTGTSTLKVFVVCSSSGGTGSAGLLEVLHKVWVAARGLGITPEIRVFTYLPGVFEYAITTTSAAPLLEKENQAANAYAFLRELDHFVVHSDELDDAVCNPAATPATNVPPGQLVKQVYLVDATIDGGGVLSNVTDAYEIVGEAIYQFLMTDAGRPQIAQNGTNTDQLLTMLDGHGKRRVYCGLGVASVTYPGDTYRRHLRARLADWLIRELLVPRPVDLPTQVRDHPGTDGLLDELRSLHGSVTGYDPPPDVSDLRILAESAPEQLKEDQSEEVVTRILSTFEARVPRAVKAMQEQLRSVREQALSQVESVVIDAVFRTGYGVPFGIEMIKHAERVIDDMRADASEVRATNQRSAPQLEDEANELRRKLRALNQRTLVIPGQRVKAGEALGDAIRAWGDAVLGEHEAEGEVRFLDGVRQHLERLRLELEKSELELQKLAGSAYKAWTADELIGKDAGPRDTTALIPSDVQPEVERSSLAVAAFAEVIDRMNKLNLIELIQDLYQKWRRNGEGRGAFGLGSGNPDESEQARAALIGELDALAARYALEEGELGEDADAEAVNQRLILPRNLEDAAARSPEGDQALTAGIKSLVALSRRACWVWSAANLGDIQYQPSPSTAIIRPKSLARRVDPLVGEGNGIALFDSPDEERIVALTTEWGVSAHGLSPVAAWEPAYERMLAGLAEDGTQKRPHLDKRWHKQLQALVPPYFDRDSILVAIARAFLAAEVVGNDEIAARLFGSAAARSRPLPIATIDEGESVRFEGVIFREDDTTDTWVLARTIPLGSTHVELIDAVGEAADYRQSLEVLTKAALDAAGRPRLIEILEQLAEDRFRPLLSLDIRSDEEREAIDDLYAVLVELRTRYEQAEVQAGRLSGG